MPHVTRRICAALPIFYSEGIVIGHPVSCPGTRQANFPDTGPAASWHLHALPHAEDIPYLGQVTTRFLSDFHCQLWYPCSIIARFNGAPALRAFRLRS
ncbi:hypothetical protein BKA82DRAFT_1009235, partial [Pisolithus tinctorius]